ncbi:MULTISPECIES: methylenetetrahydrofolate reductase C-terminal domain-containing protein [Marinobacter]|uniref:methylenetetrahydrofolate reductase C-terminal domain-containing protein n=1 Tax=Marinobacter TaxID=2742 RepID=UPI001B148DB4|nr:methylenetetrahydrofolate reductase C-terminal domain-containing protein [Marinobacter sp.]MBO6812715.1 methylenetetrahydrofolate reductase C-terminal domain-containing protein [Marinobacter sp.]MBO6873871.1 methylenetetrahydrofolate reductase C-terminal domain-containing protein [Marinobacter sp.]
MQSNYRNLIKDGLARKEFIYTLEHVPELLANIDQGLSILESEAELVATDDRVRGVNIGDRVKSMHSVSTVECGSVAAKASGKMPLLHLAGKNREVGEARAVFKEASELGLKNYLIISGDRVTEETHEGRTRYLDSVIGIVEAKKIVPDSFIAAGVTPFKYKEEELLNQYLKMAKKINAGVDYFITNCGWDMDKFQELIWYRDARGFDTPIVANLLMPMPQWAKGIHAKRLPGVFMSDDLYAKIQEEISKDDAKRSGFQRLVLQIVGVKLMGYAGVQLSGVDTYSELREVMEAAEDLEKELTSMDLWREAWDRFNTLGNGEVVEFAPEHALYLFPDGEPRKNSLSGPPVLPGNRPNSAQMRKYHFMHYVHEHMFKSGSFGAAILAPVFRFMDKTTVGRSILLKAEHSFKEPMLGCESCGFCRIQYLSYACPETCPKGLANGPCAGTDENTCEFKDRECIHNLKYRIAKEVNKLGDLEKIYIPAVEGTRNTPSWANEFKEDAPVAQVLGRRNDCDGVKLIDVVEVHR